MKKVILLILSGAFFCPQHVVSAAEETALNSNAINPIANAEMTTKKDDWRKNATKIRKPRKGATATHKKRHPKPHHKIKKSITTKENTPLSKNKRAKITTAGVARRTKDGRKALKSKATSRAKKATYGAKSTTVKRNLTKRAPSSSKSMTGASTTKRVYRKGGVTYRHFNHLPDMVPQELGTINEATTQDIALNKPGRGYKNANLINFKTSDGKTGQIVLDTHNITAKRAERKGFAASTHGKESVEVFAGNEADGKGLALIGEYPLTGTTPQISIDPTGKAILSGTEKPIEFSVHQ